MLSGGRDISGFTARLKFVPAFINISHIAMHNACHHLTLRYFTRRNAARSPSSDAFTWARARARRDITVPIGTP